jgi:hypothetical protein
MILQEHFQSIIVGMGNPLSFAVQKSSLTPAAKPRHQIPPILKM